ncbi:MAG: DNA-binding protein [Candidatus Micrarchaeia archaeon]
MPQGEESAQDDSRRLYEQKMRQMQLEAQKKELLRKMLDERGYERMTNVRLSNPELYEKVVQSLAYVAQSGKHAGKIPEEQLYKLLQKMTSERKTSIEFRRK